MRLRKRYLLVPALVLPALGWASIQPSNDRDWAADGAVLPIAAIDGDRVTVYNIRNFRHVTTDSFVVGYYDKTFDLAKLRSVWFLVEPFSKEWEGPAHTMASFGFEEDGREEYVAISVEVRKEKGEHYSAIGGLLKRLELMYVVGDERDLIRLRTNVRQDSVYLYPIRTTQAKMRALFLDMLRRANTLRERPEFYNTLTSNCTTNLVGHVNRIATRPVPRSYKVILPGYSDRLAYELGLIDTDLPFEQARQRFKINARARAYGDSADFSQRIRGPEPTAAQ